MIANIGILVKTFNHNNVIGIGYYPKTTKDKEPMPYNFHISLYIKGMYIHSIFITSL